MPPNIIKDARITVERAATRREADEHEMTAGAAKRAAAQRVLRLRRRSGVRRFVFENGLSLAAMAMFVLAFAGQIAVGVAHYNDNRREHGEPPVGVATYLTSGEFIEATAENWESEFLQMGIFVILTAFLYQRGSSESKGIEEPEPVDQSAAEARGDPDAPWPVRAGGLPLAVYKHSLSAALLAMFAVTFVLHAVGGAREYNDDRRQHGGPPVSTLGYMATSTFWFESLQNWQSEFLSVGVLVLLTIWLREQGSPQSKPVGAASRDTGD